MSDIEKTDIAFGEIANALKSSAADHILGIAEDIYDSDLKKYQSEINAELSNKNFDDKYAPISHTHSKSEITDFAHTHNYAGSSSAGGAATSANQLNKIAGSTPGAAAKSGTSVSYYTLIGTTKDENNKRYAGDNTGFPVTSNANGLLWLGNHPNASDSNAIGYGSQLGFSSDGNIYYRYITNGNIPTDDNGGSWKKLSYDGHAHDSDYLRLSGGDMTGLIKSMNIWPATSNTYVLGRNQGTQYRNVYSKEFTEDGVSLATKYAPKTHEHDEVYKPLQRPVTEPADDTRPATMFINSITQDANGVISAAKKTVPTMIGATASSDGLSGLVPAPTIRDTALFLKGDGTWSKIPLYIGANMTAITDGISGLVPACPVSATTAFLRGDGVWTQPRTMTGATSSIAGSSGFVPAPATRDYASFLRGDGTWALPANATTSAAGFMSAEDKTKLDGIEEGANNYSLPIASSSTLGGIKVGTGLSITSTTGVLSHSTSEGYKHIPSGGSSGQYLKYSSSGTATWATPANATTSTSGFMSADDKNKLDKINYDQQEVYGLLYEKLDARAEELFKKAISKYNI